MPTATYDTGTYGTDTYYEEPAPPTIQLGVRERPSLRVSVDVETPGGKHYRWAEDEPRPESVPSGLRFSDTMPGGFESFDCTLPRKPELDYGDLEQLSTIRVLGASGDIAGEYRLERAPRTSGDQMSISPGAVGWQAHLEDDKSAREIYVDRDLSHWSEAGITRKVEVGAAFLWQSFGVRGDSTGLAGLEFTIRGPWATQPVVEAWYGTVGIPIKTIHYSLSNNNNPNTGDANWSMTLYEWDRDHAAGGAVGEFLDDIWDAGAQGTQALAPSGYATPSGPALPYVLWQWYYAAAAGGGELDYTVWLSDVAVYGDHGLTIRGAAPGGVFASDVVAHAVGRWAPALTTTTESVQPSGFIVPHLAFQEPTTAGEIVRQATRFGLQDWAVWDNKTFWWHERGAFSKLWRSRVSPAQLDETGPQVERLWESIIVSYQDVDGSTRTVGPPGSGANVIDASLKNDDPDNPANQLGIIRRDVLQMGTSTPAGAIEVGRRFLQEAQLLDRSGRARVVGHVEDDHGVLHPYWRPRAGDYISFTDAADTSPRRIVKTDKDHASRTCGLDLDAPPEGLKALLERLGVVLVPLGLS